MKSILCRAVAAGCHVSRLTLRNTAIFPWLSLRSYSSGTSSAGSIWNGAKVTLDQINARNKNMIHEVLGIEATAIGDDYIEATMPVDHRTHQPMGLLHGGASVVLAESLGSIASSIVAGPTRAIVGIEVNANHLRAIRSGKVIGRVTPLRLGKSLHVWNIEIRNAAKPEDLICVSRLTVMVIPKEGKDSKSYP